jgi:hypothetical protein
MNQLPSYDVVFVFWTDPMFSKNLKGYNKDRNSENKLLLHDYEIEIQKLSALSAKKFIGNTTLYTDTNGLTYLKSIGLDSYYDNINTELLDKFNTRDFDKGYFWTSGKTYVICNQSNPFVFLDLDFVVKEQLPSEFFECDLVHNQWELQRGKFYLSESKLTEINLEYWWHGMLMPNTSFLIVNKLELLKEYWKLHNSLILKYGKSKVDETIWLLADQGILSFVIRKLKLNVFTIEPNIFVEKGEYDFKNIKYGAVPYYINMDWNNYKKINYYHMWLDKQLVHGSEKIKQKFMSRTYKELLEVIPNKKNIL